MLVCDGQVDVDGIRAAEQLIADEVCRSVIYCEATSSTNSLALSDLQQRAVGVEQTPRLYFTDRQTSGRGRHGRDWISTPQSLAFSLLVDQPPPSSPQASGSSPDRLWKLMSLAVGVAIARSLEFEYAPLRTRLKWPNDVHLDGGKLAGILLETNQVAPEQVVIGVGINIGEPPQLGPHSELRPVSSLSQVVGHQVHRYDVLPTVTASIVRTIAELGEFADDLLDEFRSRCLLTGQQICFQEGTQTREGMCHGISDDGELLVESDNGAQQIQSGEARLVRPLG